VAPNILLVHVDQLRFDCLAAHGHPQIRTPTLDGLVRSGVDCVHAFTPIPICTPARASLLTGRWASQHGSLSIPSTTIYRPHDPACTSLWSVLRDAGYQQGMVGKYHRESPVAPNDALDYFAGPEDYKRWRSGAGIPEFVRTNGWFGEVDPHITPDQSQLAWGADQTIACVERFVGAGRPWMMRWDPYEPHLPCVIAQEMEDWYPPGSIAPWPAFGDPLEGKPYIQHQQRRSWGVDAWTWAEWAPVVSRYLATIELLDRQLGRVLASLARMGVENDTLVIFSTDHGDYCGDRGQMDKHFAMYDELVRVPLILRWPGVLPQGRVCQDFICNEVDLATTIAHAVGSQPDGFEGVDLIPVLRGDSTTGRSSIFSQYEGSQLGSYQSRMVRDRDWKYVWNATAEDELYDLRSDPREWSNLARDPARVDQLLTMRSALVQWMQEIGDPLLNSFTRRHFARPGVKW
jgi:arylsulfatase A-like enzyme